MASKPSSQRKFAFGLVLGFVLITIVTAQQRLHYDNAADVTQSKPNIDFEFVPLAEAADVAHGGRIRRQTANSNNLNVGKSRSGTGVSGKASLKLDKNSASNPSDGSINNQSSSSEEDGDDEKGDYDEQLIEDFYGNFTQDTELPKIHHDHHLYYNSTVVMAPQRIQEFWVDLSQMDQSKVITHDMLSKSYRRAATVSLSFNFPFYGHVLKNATIATGGFLYLGDYMHSWLASTQYIAPLMANFDTRLNANSVIKYADNGTDFVVQWEETALQDFVSAGTFTFQARLRHTGDIVFAYSKIPIGVSSIPDSEHPVRIGVSDAYIIDRAMLFHTRKIIYEYHRVEIKKDNIANLTAVYLTALPSCITLKDCESCLNSDLHFDCTWCVQAQRCSDGMDRYRHDWLYRGCDSANQQLHEATCPPQSTSTSMANVSKIMAPDDSEISQTVPPLQVSSTQPTEPSTDSPPLLPNNITVDMKTQSNTLTHPDTPNPTAPNQSEQFEDVEHNRNVAQRRHRQDKSIGAGGILGLLFVVTVIAALMVWVGYAYKYPHTPSGQIIIRYRPSQWHWLKGEADYTPASVHI